MTGRHRKDSDTAKNLTAIATTGTLTGLPLFTTVPVASSQSGPDWNPIIHCESGGNPSIVNSIGAAGWFQFITTTWQGYGGGEFAPTADQATPAQQLEIANRAYAVEGYNPWVASQHCWDANGDGVPDAGNWPDYVGSIGASSPEPAREEECTPSGKVFPTEGDILSGFQTAERPDHNGVDVAAPDGTPIYAAASGTVVQAGPADGFGQWIVIDHGDGYQTGYGHMWEGTLLVSVGDAVEAGQQIASVGSNGDSTGPHLHFFVTENGSYIDPEGWLQDAGETCGTDSEPAPSTPAPAPSSESPAPAPESAPVEVCNRSGNYEGGDTYTVVEGDCLSTIAIDILGMSEWRSLYLRNMDQIKDPDLIFPGQVLVIPK